MDISLPGLDGSEATRIIRKQLPGSDVIVVSQNDPATVSRQASNVGAAGYVWKGNVAHDLFPAIERVVRNGPNGNTSVVEPSIEIKNEQRTEPVSPPATSSSGEIARSDQQFRMLAELIPQLVWMAEPDGHIFWYNQRWYEYTGTTPRQMEGWGWQSVHHPEVLPKVLEAWKRSIATGEPFEMVFPLRGADGTFRDFLTRIHPLKDDDGNVLRWFGTNTDVTAQRKTEEAIRESEQRFREMIDAIPAVIYTTDAEGRITHFNSAAVEFAGREPEIGVDRWCVTWRLFLPDGTPMPHSECPMAVALKEGRIVEGVECIAERPDGTRVWFTPYPRLLKNCAGEIVGGVNMLVDITGRKQAEEAKSYLAAIVASSDDAIVSKGLDGIIRSWNKGAERIFGYTAEEAIGKHITLIIPEDRHAEEDDILRRLRRGERVDHFETIRRRKDGSTFDVSLTISPLKDSKDRVIGASKVARDISHLKRIERELRDSEQRLRALVNASAYVVYRMNSDWTEIRQFDGRGFVSDRTKSKQDWLQEYIYSDDQTLVLQAIDKAIATKSTFELEHRVCHPDGSIGWTVSRAVPILDKDGEITEWFGAATDITDRKVAEENYRKLAETLDAEVRARTNELEERNAEVLTQSEQVRELSWRLLHTQDEERRHIARELHDSAGQTLTVLGMNLAQFVHKAARHAPDLASEAETIQEMVQQLHREVRTTSYLLHPPLLDESGLYSALSWYMHGLEERSGLQIRFDMSEEFGRLPRDMELVVFRLVQECLTNIHRHSGSKTGSIRIAHEGNRVRVEVRDEGKGMPPERLAEIQSSGAGVGVRGMRERLRQFKGEMKIESDASGTRILVTIPIPKGAVPEDAGRTESFEPAL